MANSRLSSVWLQLRTRKSSRCFSIAKASGSSITGSVATTVTGAGASPRKRSISAAYEVMVDTVPMEPVEFCSASLMAERAMATSSQRTARRCGNTSPGAYW